METTIISRTADRRIGTTPAALYAALMAAEIDGGNAPDMRRVIRDERQSLGQALERVRDADARLRRAEAIRYLSERIPAVQSARADRDRAVADMIETTAETITPKQIRLRHEAWLNGDTLQVALCNVALADDFEAIAGIGAQRAALERLGVVPGLVDADGRARQRCADAINAARAEDDATHDMDVDPYGTAFCRRYGAQP
jgi:hypothetical protein